MKYQYNSLFHLVVRLHGTRYIMSANRVVRAAQADAVISERNE